MSEKLIIKNFGPIKDVEFELKQFNFLIGENATGKSTVAKMLAICRYFSYIIDDPEIAIWEDSHFVQGLNAWGLKDFLQSDSYIKYDNNHYSFIASTYIEKEVDHEFGVKEWIAVKTFLEPKSEEFRKLLAELDKIKPKPPKGKINSIGIGWTIPTSFFQNEVAAIMDNPFYLPAERGLQSIFSLGKSSIQNISDSLFNQFAKLDQIARLFKTEINIEPLGIIYKNEGGRGYIKNKDGNQFYSLFNAATGYQSTIPIILLTKYYTDLYRKNKTFIIEEPELNLFPSAQSRLVEYLADTASTYNNALLITTHSPYTLTTVNTLMYAYIIGESKIDEVEAVIPSRYWINPMEVSAYEMKNGFVENILTEDGLIKAETIDVISREINEKFDRIQDIKLSS